MKVLEFIGRIKTIQTTALLRSARIPRRVLETWRELLSLILRWKITSQFGKVTTSKIILIIITIIMVIMLNNNNNNNDNNDSDTNCYWSSRYSYKIIGSRTGGLGYRVKSRDHPNNSIDKIGQNTEKSPGDLMRFTVTQTPVRNHRLTLVWKTLK